MTKTSILRAIVSFGIAIPTTLFAQPWSGTLDTPGTESSAWSFVYSVPSKTASNTSQKPFTDRWLELSKMSASFRYRQAFNQGSAKTFDDGQEQMIIVNKFKLDREARYTINLRASSGGYFDWSYADIAGHGFAYRQHKGLIKSSYDAIQAAERSAAGKADPAGLAITTGTISTGWPIYLRELYGSATPIKQVTVEFGSLGIERGMASEITTFDDDGWVTGERIRIKDPKHLFFTEVGYTNAYFGEIGTPNVFRRGEDFTEWNYRQVYGKKQLNKRIGFSADYTYIGGTDTARQAIEIEAKPTKIFDTVRVETYQRLDTVNLQGLNIGPGAGFAFTFEKQVNKRISGNVGFASIDEGYSVYAGHRVQHAVGMSMNGDSYGQGQRPFIHGQVKLNSFITASGFYTHAINNILDLNQQNLNGALTFDLKAMANLKTRVF